MNQRQQLINALYEKAENINGVAYVRMADVRRVIEAITPDYVVAMNIVESIQHNAAPDAAKE